MKTFTRLILLLAIWSAPYTAHISWVQPKDIHKTCLYRNQVFITCWIDLAAGPTYTILGGTGPTNALYHPQIGDTITMTFDDEKESTPLLFQIHLPVAQHNATSQKFLYLSMIRR